jgi:hypothetical protein
MKYGILSVLVISFGFLSVACDQRMDFPGDFVDPGCYLNNDCEPPPPPPPPPTPPITNVF